MGAPHGISAKVWAHVTEVSFGEVEATWRPEGWQVRDRRRFGERVVSEGLSFEAAVARAYEVSTRSAYAESPRADDKRGGA